MALPVVAIVGRPNIGKSTLFNRIVGERIAIVEDKPGITRDRIYGTGNWLEQSFHVIDTGGIEIATDDPLLMQVKYQAELAIDEADVIILLVDGKDGVTNADQDIATFLQRTQKPVILAVNKLDNPQMLAHAYEFYELGLGEPFGISCAHGIGIGDLLDEVCKHLQNHEAIEYDEDVIKIAIIGRPNVGKSSLVNALLGEERVIVSPVAGTTRDAIDSPFEENGQRYVLIDTAGMRKRGKVYENTEKYSVMRAMRAIERADVILVVIDGHQGIIEQDKHIAGFAEDAGKAIILVVNKWDIVEKDDKTMNRFTEELRSHFKFLSYSPLVFLSAKTKAKLHKLLPKVNDVAEAQLLRLSTSAINDLLNDALAINPPPSDNGRPLKISYITQVGVKPPTFALFMNDPEIFHFSYRRYLENKIREAYVFEGTPIRLLPRKK